VSQASATRPDVAVRALLVLLSCLGLAGTSLAAAHGGAAAPDPAAAVVAAARTHLGDTYTWGATGPETFDCSGLTDTVWTQAGGIRRMPRTSAQQQAWAVPIPAEQALAGDLVFFGDPVTHVGLVTGRVHGALQMVDASASRKGVVERAVWFTGTVRFGRVPRTGMPAVRPWTPPAPTVPPAANPAPTPAPTAVPLVSPREPALRGKQPLAGLPSRPAPSTATMQRFVTLARQQVGVTTWTDTSLVTALWQRAGGVSSPDSRPAIHNRTHRVLVRNAEVGDLVVYAAPDDHVGIYVGAGWMIDASRSLGHVVLRPVWAGSGVQIVRWNK
jgi:cell wall-associated NlpC family hydrolase